MDNVTSGTSVTVDETEKMYDAVVTDVGNDLMMQAIAEGKRLKITEFAVGDANGEYYRPVKSMTALIHETWRGPINSAEISKGSGNIMIVTAICPGDAGGFTIREMGVFDEAGHMIAVCNCPATPKVTIVDGVVNEMRLELEMALLNGEAVELLVDPNIVTATKKDVEEIWDQLRKNGRVTIGTAAGAYEENEIRLIVNQMPY